MTIAKAQLSWVPQGHMQQGGLGYYLLQILLMTWVNYFIMLCARKLGSVHTTQFFYFFFNFFFLEAALIDRLGVCSRRLSLL